MPQMAPIIWTLLFILFSMFLISTFIKIFFTSPTQPPLSKSLSKLFKIKKNWQW